MDYKKLVYILIALIMLPELSLGQHFFRIKADCTIKEKFGGDKSSLTIGTVYYDKNVKKVVYVNQFPEPEVWVLKDSLLYKIESGKVKSSQQLPFKPEFSIFHMSLNGSLNNYGLDDSFYKITDIEKDGGMVITTWELTNAGMGKVVISQKDKQLFGIAFFNSKDELMGKQFYKEYKNIKGLNFPTEIVEIYYKEEGETYKLTNYKNIVVDDLDEDHIYDYYISSAQ